jgi:hypothetical protein
MTWRLDFTFCRKYRDQDEGNVSLFRGKRIIGVLASATEVRDSEEKECMNSLIDSLGYQRICTNGMYSDDPCSSSQDSGDSCDAPAPLGTPSNCPTAPSAVPRRVGRCFLTPMRGPAMLVHPHLVKNRVAGFRLTL